MNSEAAGTEWIRKADAQELVDQWHAESEKWADAALEGDPADMANYSAYANCAVALAEVIARPSPDEEVVSADEWVRRCKAQNDAEARNVQPSPDEVHRSFEEWAKTKTNIQRLSPWEIWKAARGVQPSPEPKSNAWDVLHLELNTKRNIECFITRRVADLFPKASELGAIAHAKACPVKVAYSFDSAEFFTPDTWERLDAYAKEYGTNWCNRGKFNQAEARPVPQPATEPNENAKLQAFAQSRHGDMDSFYEGWDAALALRDVPQGQTDWAPLAKKLSAQLKSMGADVHPSKLEIWLEQNTALVVPVSSAKEKGRS